MFSKGLPTIKVRKLVLLLNQNRQLILCVWSSSEYDNNNAWVFCTDTGASQGGVNNNNKNNNNSNNVVRPVLAFLAKNF